VKIVTDISKLRKPCKPVTRETNLKKLYAKIDDAVRLMVMLNGCGLAANQMGDDRQFFVAVIEENGTFKARVFVNPVIVSHSEETNDDVEGCLSIPGKYGTVTRFCEITVKHYTPPFGYRTEVFSGQNARVIQHELDHLNGIVFTDKAVDVYDAEDVSAIEEVSEVAA
jgi:peptide deformylase